MWEIGNSVRQDPVVRFPLRVGVKSPSKLQARWGRFSRTPSNVRSQLRRVRVTPPVIAAGTLPEASRRLAGVPPDPIQV